MWCQRTRACTERAKTNVDNLEESSIDDLWNIDEHRILFEKWNESMGFGILNTRAPKGLFTGGRLTKTRVASRLATIWPSNAMGFERQEYKLHVRGTFTVFHQAKLKNLTPLFRTPERSWRFLWNSNAVRHTTHHRRRKLQCQTLAARRPPALSEGRLTLTKRARQIKASESHRCTQRAKLFGCCLGEIFFQKSRTKFQTGTVFIIVDKPSSSYHHMSTAQKWLDEKPALALERANSAKKIEIGFQCQKFCFF